MRVRLPSPPVGPASACLPFSTSFAHPLPTQVRRLYDIANVLSSLRLIEKTHVSDSRKPAFRWLGNEKLLSEPEAGPLTSVHWFISRRAAIARALSLAGLSPSRLLCPRTPGCSRVPRLLPVGPRMRACPVCDVALRPPAAGPRRRSGRSLSSSPRRAASAGRTRSRTRTPCRPRPAAPASARPAGSSGPTPGRRWPRHRPRTPRPSRPRPSRASRRRARPPLARPACAQRRRPSSPRFCLRRGIIRADASPVHCSRDPP